MNALLRTGDKVRFVFKKDVTVVKKAGWFTDGLNKINPDAVYKSGVFQFARFGNSVHYIEHGELVITRLSDIYVVDRLI